MCGLDQGRGDFEMSLSTVRAEKYRRPHPAKWEHKTGDMFGWFEVPIKINGPVLRIQISQGFEKFKFDHVSVSLGFRCPTWEEMCMVKDLFFDYQDCVVQYHPPKSEYVNMHQFCLHLWRLVDGDMPMPSKNEVGFK
jgi:hypothetical protein